MTAAPAKSAARPAGRITVDDLRRKAYEVRDVAKRDAERAMGGSGARAVAIGAVVVVAAISAAYFLGVRRGSRGRSAVPQPTGRAR